MITRNDRTLCTFYKALAIGIMLIACIAPARAQKAYEPSPAYEFALTYHKLAGTRPDFQAIAKKSPDYKNAGEREEAKLLKQISQRLRTEFQEMETEKQLLTLRTKLHMEVKRPTDSDKAILNLKLPGNKPLYFPMQPGKRKIAIIMRDFTRFREIALEHFKANYIDSLASSSEDIIMYLQLKPVDADAKQPIKLDGIEQWPLLTRIGRFGLYTRDKETIWEYKASWLTTEAGDNIRKLYRK